MGLGRSRIRRRKGMDVAKEDERVEDWVGVEERD